MELRGGRLQRFFRLPSGCGWWKPPGSPGTFVLKYPGVIRTGTRVNGSLLLHYMFCVVNVVAHMTVLNSVSGTYGTGFQISTER